MPKLFNKTLLRILALVLIGVTILTLSPLAASINQDQDVARSSRHIIPAFAASEVVYFLSGLLLRASHEEFAFCLQKIIATYAVVVNASIIGVKEIRLFAERQHYALANDLHFNTPFLIYCQPSSEHSSEG